MYWSPIIESRPGSCHYIYCLVLFTFIVWFCSVGDGHSQRPPWRLNQFNPPAARSLPGPSKIFSPSSSNQANLLLFVEAATASIRPSRRPAVDPLCIKYAVLEAQIKHNPCPCAYYRIVYQWFACDGQSQGGLGF